MHDPAATTVTVADVRSSPPTRDEVAPDTEQTAGVVLASTTGAEDPPPVTASSNGASPKVRPDSAGKSRLWAAFCATPNDRPTGSAAR